MYSTKKMCMCMNAREDTFMFEVNSLYWSHFRFRAFKVYIPTLSLIFSFFIIFFSFNLYVYMCI